MKVVVYSLLFFLISGGGTCLNARTIDCGVALRSGEAVVEGVDFIRGPSPALATIGKLIALKKSQGIWKSVSRSLLPERPWTDLSDGRRIVLTEGGEAQMRTMLIGAGVGSVDEIMPIAVEYMGAQLDGLDAVPVNYDVSGIVPDRMKKHLNGFSLSDTIVVRHNGGLTRILNRNGLQMARGIYGALSDEGKPDFGSFVRIVETHLNSLNKK